MGHIIRFQVIEATEHCSFESQNFVDKQARSNFLLFKQLQIKLRRSKFANEKQHNDTNHIFCSGNMYGRRPQR